MAEEQYIKLLLKDISCSGCAMDMETVLLNTDGVLEAAVRYADGIITIAYDPEDIDRATLLAKVHSFGFKVEEIG